MCLSSCFRSALAASYSPPRSFDLIHCSPCLQAGNKLRDTDAYCNPGSQDRLPILLLLLLLLQRHAAQQLIYQCCCSTMPDLSKLFSPLPAPRCIGPISPAGLLKYTPRSIRHCPPCCSQSRSTVVQLQRQIASRIKLLVYGSDSREK